MNPDDKPRQCQVFGTPDFSDPTLYQRKSEVIGWLNQKWRNREYSDFQPPILPAAQMKMMGNDIMRYYMVEHCGVKAGISCVMGYGMGCLMGLFLYGGQADMAMAQGQLQPEYRGFRAELRGMRAKIHTQGKQFGMIGMMFAGTECLLDGYRGWHDWTSSPTTGFIVGGALGLRAGVKPGIMGGTGFAIFSYIIDRVFNLH